MKVYSYVMTLVRDPHLAEEITQETFFKALKTKSPCKNRSGEFTWLCAIAKRTCIDGPRRRRKLETGLTGEGYEPAPRRSQGNSGRAGSGLSAGCTPEAPSFGRLR